MAQLLSNDPVDILIRSLIPGVRPVEAGDVAAIGRHLAQARFSEREARVLVEHRGLAFRSRTLRARETSLDYHLFKRTIVRSQWGPDTSPREYVADLRRIPGTPASSLAVYRRRAGHIAIAFAPTRMVLPRERIGTQAEAFVAAIYSADWGKLISGYQFSQLDQLALPKETRWLKR
jgi:hypothetical protein